MYLCLKLGKSLLRSLDDTSNSVDSRHGSAGPVHNAVRMKQIINEIHPSLV